jgi:probable rRNA maturation factor
MSYHVDVQNERKFMLDESRLRTAAETVLSLQTADPESGVAIVIADNETVADLNRRYRGIDSPTDVLSFPADTPPIELPDEPPYLGDLVIAYPYAVAQAEQEGHDIDDSFALLVIHGILHLLGFDHDTPENRAQMWTAQDEALSKLGVSTAIVPALEG